MQTPQNIAPCSPDRGALNGEIMTASQIAWMDYRLGLFGRSKITLPGEDRQCRVSLAASWIEDAEPIQAWMIGAVRVNNHNLGA